MDILGQTSFIAKLQLQLSALPVKPCVRWECLCEWFVFIAMAGSGCDFAMCVRCYLSFFSPSTWLNIKRWNQAMFNIHRVSWRPLTKCVEITCNRSFHSGKTFYLSEQTVDFLWDNENTSTPTSVLGVEVLCLNHIFSNPEHSEWIYVSAFVRDVSPN